MTDDAPIAGTGPEPPLVAGTGTEDGRGRAWPLAMMVGAAAAVIGWIQMPAGATGWLYAEDGVLFVGDWIGPGANVSVLWAPYAGYQHLIPRITTGLITGFLPVAWWGVAVNIVACLVVGGIAALVFVLSRDVIAFVPSRVVLGLITTLVPLVAVEAIGNLANLHWFLLYLTPWLLLATPRSALSTWALAAVALLTTLTEPQCAVFLPLAVARLTPWKVFPRAGRPVIWAWLIGVAVQLITTVLAPRPVGGAFPPVASAVQGYVLNAGMSLSTVNTELLGRVLTHAGWWIGFVGVAAIFTLAGLGFGKGRPIERITVIVLLYGSLVSWLASFALGRNPDFYYSEFTAAELASPPLVRWGTAASMLLVATIPVSAAVLVRRYPRWWPAWSVLLAAVVVVMALNVIGGPAADPRSWNSAVEAAASTCISPDGSFVVATPPGPEWLVTVPCAKL